MPIAILAQTTSTNSNAPGGAIFTFAFPIILFAVIATALYFLLFGRPHRRVPSNRIVLATSAAGAPTASSGGSAESAGARRDTAAGGDAADSSPDGSGNVSGEAGGDSDQGTEASE